MVDPEEQFNICDQRLAILEGTGHMLVTGGPGSGKTTIALLKARRNVLENLRPEQSVLFLSFSNSAIRRILESAGNILTAEIGSYIEIKTYHSFAWDILRSHGYLLSSQRYLTIVAAQDAAVIRAGLEDEEWDAEETRLFIADGRLTYDQFASRAADLIERSTVIRKRFSHAYPLILVDEFQDTDEDQWRLIRKLSQNSEVIALGDTEQRIYAWRKGVSSTRLPDFAEALDAAVFDFQYENNRSPATGIMGYARSLLSPEVKLDLPIDIEFKRFTPGNFKVGLRFALIRTWNETVRRAGHRNLSVVVAARSRTMVRQISDALAQNLNVHGTEYSPVTHDVLIDVMQITLAARVIAFVMASESEPHQERLAGALDRIGAVYRSAGNKSGIGKSNQLSRWAENCRSGKVPKTKCVRALSSAFEEMTATGLVGSPTEDWLVVRHLFENSDAEELKRTGGHARYLRLLRRGSAIEERLGELWKAQRDYVGAEAALDEAIVQDQLMDNYRETFGVSVMTMHQLKAREYDAVLLVEDQHRTFLGKENEPPFMETRRLLQVSLTRARHFVCILAGTRSATLDKLFTI